MVQSPINSVCAAVFWAPSVMLVQRQTASACAKRFAVDRAAEGQNEVWIERLDRCDHLRGIWILDDRRSDIGSLTKPLDFVSEQALFDRSLRRGAPQVS